jgi:hypothetical protein
MNARMIAAAALVTAFATPAAAQSGASADCFAQQTGVQDACQKAVDLFNFMAPQLGTSLSGGNAVSGTASTLGGLGHFSVGLRANVVNGRLPDMASADVGFSGPQASDFAVEKQVLGLPTVDAAVGIFGGVPLGITRVGGVDLLVNAAYLPEYDGDGLAITTPDGALKLGFGARVGLLQESLVVPGVAVTYLRRDLPTVSVLGQFEGTTGNDELSLRDLSVKTDAWRVVASKSFFVFGLAAGAGQDKYETSTTLGATVRSGGLACNVATPCQTTPVSLEQSLTRTNYFGSLSLNLLMLKIVGEVGQVSGGEVNTYNTFDGNRADDSLLYGSVAFRFGF